MATSNDTKVKIIDIQVKYQDAVDAMGKYRSSIEEAQTALKQLKKDLKDGKISQEEYNRQSEASRAFVKQQNDAINTLSRQVQNQIKVTKESEGSLKQLRAKLSNATAAYDAMSRTEREGSKGKELKNHIVEITNELKEAEQGTLRFYRNVGNYPNSVNTALNGITDKFRQLGSMIAAVFTVDKLFSFGEKAKQVGSDYADQMAKVRSVTNANAVEFAQMSKEAERLGSTTRYTAQQAAESMEYLTRNGLDAVTATGTLSGVLHLAQANAIELAEAADIVTGQMNAFHLSVNDVTRINDVLSYTCAKSATNILQLNEALKNTAPIAYTAGVSIEETCAALGTLADNNIKGADSGTILKQAFNGMITSTKLSKKAYDELGISMDISTVKADGFIGSLKKIMDAGPSVQQLSDIFGRRAVPGVLALTNSIELLGDKFQSISENAAGTADRMFEQAYSKFTVAADSLKSAWEGFLIQLWQGTDQEIRDKFVKEGEEIDAQFVPRIESLKQKLSELNTQFATDQNNEALLEEIRKTSEVLGGVSREYGLSKQLLSQQMQVEQTGNQALIDKWKQGTQVIDKEYLPKIEQVKSEIASLSEQLQSDPTNGTIKEELAAKEATLKDGITAYSTARQEFQDSMSEEIEASTSGMAGMLQGPIEQLTLAIQFVKANISEIGTLLVSVIAGISFAKLISGAVSAFTQIRNSAVTNAQAATAQVGVCQNNELTLRRQCATLTSQLENASASERERIETQLVAKKRELANAEKLTHKAKTAEIAMWERAAALETGNGWTRAFTVAKMGVVGFVSTAKAAFKGFIVTAILSLAFELIMKLFEKTKEGKGIFGDLKKWVVNAFNTITNAIINVINYFIDLYNESLVVRLAVQAIALQFKNLWEGVKLIFNLMINGVKSVGRSLSGLGTMIKGVLTFDAGTIKNGWNDIVGNFGKTIKEQAGAFKNFGKNVADNFINAFNDTVNGSKIEHVKFKMPEDNSSPKTSGSSASGGTSTTETQTEDEITSGVAGSSSGSGGNKKTSDKKANAISKAAQEEAKLVAEAEKAMLDLLGESIEKRRAMLESQYNNEINKLQVKLDTDKTLTEGSKEAINQLIKAKAQKLQDELSKLEDENIKKRIQDEQKLIESRLSIISKGSEDELKLKQQQLIKKREIDLIALKQEEEAAQKGAATALMFRQAALDELEASGSASEERLARAREAVVYAQSEIARINEEYAEMRLNIQEEYFNKEDELRREHDQAVFNEQQQYLKNRIAQLEMSHNEELNAVTNFAGDKMTLQQSIDQLGLNVVSENEIKKMQLQESMAEQKLSFIQEQGRLETETEEQYNERVLSAKQEVSNAKARINQASLTNEQAYVGSMKNLTNSMVTLLDTFGKENKALAVLSKMITLFQITVDTGRAISSGVASASALPYPANLAAIATTVATVLANVATAVSTVKSAKFAKGGKVEGPGTGTSDSINAWLSNGEFVMTANATKIFEPLLIAMNSIGSGFPLVNNSIYERTQNAESISDSFYTAVKDIKPVVSVVEITRAQNRVNMIQNLENI